MTMLISIHDWHCCFCDFSIASTDRIPPPHRVALVIRRVSGSVMETVYVAVAASHLSRRRPGIPPLVHQCPLSSVVTHLSRCPLESQTRPGYRELTLCRGPPQTVQVVRGLARTVTDSRTTGLEMTRTCLMIYPRTTPRGDRQVSHQRGTMPVDPTRTDQHPVGRTCSPPHHWCLVVAAKICTVLILMNEYTVQACRLALSRSVYHLVKTLLISKEV